MTATKDLSVLEAAGLVSVATLQPDLEYMFRHALLQDAAYASLLRQERRELHRRVADALDALYPRRREELSGVVALHLEEAGAADEAAGRYLLAGQHALARFAKTEARGFFERVLRLIPPDETRTDIRALRARAIVGSTRAGWTMVPAEADADRLRAALPDVEATGDIQLIADAHFWHVFLRRALGQTPETSPDLRASVERGRELAERGGDVLGVAMAEGFRGMGLVMAGELREGVAALEQHVPTIEEQGDALSAALLLDILATGQSRLGRFAEAEKALARAERLSRGGDPIARLDSLISRATLAAERGEDLPAIELATTCARDADALGAPLCAVGANLLVGAGHLRIDDAPGALPPLERGHQLALSVGLAPLQSLSEGLLRATAVRLGEHPADGAWEDALTGARRFGDRYGEATILAERAAARIRAAGPIDPTVLDDLDAAIRLFEESEARPAVARALRERSRALGAMGLVADADVALGRAEEIEKELGIRPRVEGQQVTTVQP